MVKTEILKITPELAKMMIEKNITTNRKIRKSRVDELARLILENKFYLTHQGLAFSETGDLIDGQHRLNAIIQANKPVEMMITTGLKQESFSALDRGLQRSMSDILINNEKRVVEVATTLTRLTVGTQAARLPHVVLEVLNKKRETIVKVHNLYKGTKKYTTMPFLLAATVFHEINPDFVEKIHKAVCTDDFGNYTTMAIAVQAKIGRSGSLQGKKVEGQLGAFILGCFLYDETKKDGKMIKVVNPIFYRSALKLWINGYGSFTRCYNKAKYDNREQNND